MAQSMEMVRLESFPFDSKADGYDSDGYPIYDRAVGATMLRETFAKFFTNGVFPSPGSAFQIDKAEDGLKVTVQPGIGIINGAMGGVLDGTPVSLTLDTQPPKGNTCYGIMLRFDSTDSFADSRSLLLNVVRGDSSANPQPPSPDHSSPGVYELRLGYVTVPSGALNLDEATVTNEKGLAVCPYAAPFEDLDMSAVVANAQIAANDIVRQFQAMSNSMLDELQADVDSYLGLLQSALDETTAGYLQEQINNISVTSLTEPEVTQEWSGTPVSGDTKKFLNGEGLRQVSGIVSDVIAGVSLDIAGDLAVLRYDVGLSSSLADEEMDSVIVWEFPDDATASAGNWDSTNGYYYTEAN